ncbi:MAG: hypothetical protein J5746_12155 [Victivallales bacterium]|nr:hypothetical protein [Victivallales bacterium]
MRNSTARQMRQTIQQHGQQLADEIQKLMRQDAEQLASGETLLSSRYGECPFSVLNTNTGRWRGREREYKDIGLQSGCGRDVELYNTGGSLAVKRFATGTSVFSAHLCELVYDWYCPDGGSVLDPFAGGSVRGIVAGMRGHSYTGIDIRQEQIDANLAQVESMADRLVTRPQYICGDSRALLDDVQGQYDLVFTCPPYGDLEVYSKLEGDISNMSYHDFIQAYCDIIKKSCGKLKEGCFAVFVVGDFRDSKGFLQGFVPDTVYAFQLAGMNYYNEMILETPAGTAPMRAKQFDASRKILKIHQNVLVFCKGRPDRRNFRKFDGGDG